jgi:N-acetylneuraminate lyase
MSIKEIDFIKGVIPAMITTFDSNEEVDYKRATIFVEYLLNKGADGLYITGSTGEGFLMDMEERKAYAECIMTAVNGRVPVIVHIGAIGTKKSIELAKHAQSIGADAISSVPPFYYGYSDHDLFNYYKDISDAVEVPMIVYNISLAGLMNNGLIEKLATIENVKGLKFTGREHDDMCAIKAKLGKNFMVYSGCDEMATQGLLAGADGLIGSTYNLMCETFVSIYKLSKENKFFEAFKIQKVATALIKNMLSYDFFPTLKASIRYMGVDVGYARKPFIAPTDEQFETFIKACKELKSIPESSEIDFLKTL